MKKNFNSSLGLRLKSIRGSLPQSQMAEALGIPQQTYANWELGIRQPKLDDLGALSLQLGVSADYLLGLSCDPHSGALEGEQDEWMARALGAEHKLAKVNEALGKIIEGTKALQEAVK